MHQHSVIRVRTPQAVYRAVYALMLGLALPLLQPGIAGAAGADSLSETTQTLAKQSQRILNDAGQFYLAWWIPQALSEAILRETPNAAHADRLQALQPYIVFALSRAQVGAKGLVDQHDKADLLRGSQLTVNGKEIIAAATDQIDPGAQAALELIKPALAAMLGPIYGHDGSGIQFALYRPAAGIPLPDPTLIGSLDYKLYHKRFAWQLPIWAPAAPSATAAAVAPAPASPATLRLPVAPAAAAPVAPPVAVTAPALPMATPAAVSAPAASPLPVQRRKIDPTSGEEFPERYNYNPYTGQKLVSQ